MTASCGASSRHGAGARRRLVARSGTVNPWGRSSLVGGALCIALAMGCEESGGADLGGVGGASSSGGAVGASGGSSAGGVASGGTSSGGITASGGNLGAGGTIGAGGTGGFEATGGSGGVTGSGGATASCPAVPPTGAAEACDSAGPSCSYEDCDGAGLLVATCVNGVWQTETSSCSSFPCGGETCEPGQICSMQASGPLLATCIANPCGDGPVTCECAAPACAGSCSVVAGSGFGISVTCSTCATCP